MAFPLLPPSFSFLFLPPPPFPISSSMTHPSTRPTSSPFPSFLFPNLRDQKTSASVREERVGGAFSSAASLPPRPRKRRGFRSLLLSLFLVSVWSIPSPPPFSSGWRRRCFYLFSPFRESFCSRIQGGKQERKKGGASYPTLPSSFDVGYGGKKVRIFCSG